MTRLRFVTIGALLLALILAGCNPSSSTGGSQTTSLPATAAPTSAATEETAETAETAAPTESAATELPSTPTMPSGEVQREQITIDAAGLLQPTAITTTAGITLELTLDNQSDSDALLLFDLSPTGAFAVAVPSTAVITGTPTPIAALTHIPASIRSA